MHPWIQESLPGLKGDLVSFVLVFSVVAPLLLAIIRKKNGSAEFRKLWNDSRFNRAPLVSIIVIKVLICLVITLGIINRLFNVALTVGVLLSMVVVGFVTFSKWIRKRSIAMEQQFLENFQGTDDATSSGGKAGGWH